LTFVGVGVSAPATVVQSEGSGIFFNQCAGELVDVTSRITFVSRNSVTPTGSLMTLSHFTQTGSAVGQVSGDRFEFVSTQTSTEVDFASGDATRTLTSMLQLVGAGSVGSLRAHSTFHFTIRDGEIVVWLDNISFSCD